MTCQVILLLWLLSAVGAFVVRQPRRFGQSSLVVVPIGSGRSSGRYSWTPDDSITATSAVRHRDNVAKKKKKKPLLLLLYSSLRDDDDEDDDMEYAYVKRRRRRGGSSRRDYGVDESSSSPDTQDGYYSDADYGRKSSSSTRDDFYNDLDDDDDDDDDWLDDIAWEDLEEIDNEDYNLLGNEIIPNPLLDAMDPDGTADRFHELARDPRFWFDMFLFVCFLDILSIIGPRDPFPDFGMF